MGYQDSDDSGLLFYINQQRNYARTTFDRTQTFVQSYVYDLPFGKGKHWLNAGPVGPDFWAAGRSTAALTLMTGTPFEARYSATGLNAPGNTQTANQIAPVQILHGINTGNPWFSTSSFRRASHRRLRKRGPHQHDRAGPVRPQRLALQVHSDP